MAQKNASPTKEQAAVMQRHGLNKTMWVVVKDLKFSMICKHRVSGEFKVIDK